MVNVANGEVRQLTPDSEDKYKEGLEWHPDGRRLTHFHYGPERLSAKLRWVFLDRPGETEEMLDQEGHWDYVGVCAPDGRSFHFMSFSEDASHMKHHILDLETGEVRHGVNDGSLPQWSHDKRTLVWAVREVKNHFEEIENSRE